jgi:hypothetical protein
MSLDCLSLKSCIVCGSNLTTKILLIYFIKNLTQVINNFSNIWQKNCSCIMVFIEWGYWIPTSYQVTFPSKSICAYF